MYVDASLGARQGANHRVAVNNSVNPKDNFEAVWLEEETEDTILSQEVTDVHHVVFDAYVLNIYNIMDTVSVTQELMKWVTAVTAVSVSICCVTNLYPNLVI